MNKSLLRFEQIQFMRNRSFFLTMLVFTALTVSLAVIQVFSIGATATDFSRPIASLLNVVLFILSLFILTIGSMGVANEKESGWIQLIKTYPISMRALLWAKYQALVLSMLLIVGVAFGAAFVVVGFWGWNRLLVSLLLVTLLLITIFSSVAICIGALSKSRFHALTMGLSVWAFFLLLADYFLLAIGTFLPGHIVIQLVILETFINPVSFVRMLFLLWTDNASIIGPAFYSFIEFSQSLMGNFIYGLVALAWVTIPLLIAMYVLKGGR